MSGAPPGAFAAFLDAIEADDAFYLRCPQGHGSLPPQRICPECHSRELSRDSLPTTGEILTYTVVSVPAPRFSDQSPYATAIVDFGPINLTGLLCSVDIQAVDVGHPVTLTTEPMDDTRIVVFRTG